MSLNALVKVRGDALGFTPQDPGKHLYSGRRAVGPGDATLTFDIVASGKSSSYLVEATVNHPALHGEGEVRARAWWILASSLWSVPWWMRPFSVLFGLVMLPFMALGMGLVMVLSIPFRWGEKTFDDLTEPEFSRRYTLIGQEEAAVLRAFPPPLRAVLLREGFSGQCRVTPGRLWVRFGSGATEGSVHDALRQLEHLLSYVHALQ